MSTSFLGTAAGPVVAASPADVDPVLAAVVDAALRLTDADVSGVLLADADGETAEMQACAGRWTVHSANLRVRRGHGLAGRILQTGKPWKVDDYARDRSVLVEEFLPVLAEEGTRAGLGAPLRAGAQLLGVLMVWSGRRGAFDAAATQALVGLADLAAVTVMNARAAVQAQAEAAALADHCAELTDRVAALELDHEVRDELATLLIGGRELADLLAAVCLRTGGDAVMFDARLGELGACGAADPIRDRVIRHLRRRGPGADGPADGSVLPPGPGFPRWIVLWPVDGGPAARLAVCLPRSPTARDRMVIEHGAHACAVHLARERAVLEARSGVHADFVWQLLEGLVDDAVAVLRARQLGCALPARLRVVVLPLGPAGCEDGTATMAAAARLARAAGVNALVGLRGATLALVLESTSDPVGARAVVEQVVRGLRRRAPDAVGTAGVSACVEWSADLRGARRQAERARSAAGSGPERPAVLFDELGLLRFLLGPSDRADQLDFARAVLGAVLDYDRDHGCDLVGTLGTYLDCGCSLTRAAELLFVHPKTVRYRLRRAEELAGHGLSGDADRFDAELAVAILRALALDADHDDGQPARTP